MFASKFASHSLNTINKPREFPSTPQENCYKGTNDDTDHLLQ